MNQIKLKRKALFIIISWLYSIQVFSQGSNTLTIGNARPKDYNSPISTAVPFLIISPDSRASALGETGVATTADNASAYWNPAKLCFIKGDYGFSSSYNPWLSKLLGNDMWLAYLSGYYRLRKEDVIGVSLTYFNMGTIDFKDNNGGDLGTSNPREFSLSATYSRMLGKGFSAGLSAKFIRSNLLGGINVGNNGSTAVKPGQAAAVDFGLYYNKDIYIDGQKVNMAYGGSFANVGGKVSYSNNGRSDFLPGILRLGTAWTAELDDYNKLTVSVEGSKLLAPSPQFVPVPSKKNIGEDSVGGDGKVVKNFNQMFTPNKSLFQGIFGSFSDAEGGYREELSEIMIGTGVEYWYDNIFAIRGGYFYEPTTKGNRKYFTLGFGLKYQLVGFDFSYLLPTLRDNPLGNTLRFALNFNFEKPKEEVKESALE